jgi:hypothetical protein
MLNEILARERFTESASHTLDWINILSRNKVTTVYKKTVLSDNGSSFIDHKTYSLPPPDC